MQDWRIVMSDMRTSMNRLDKAKPILLRLLNGSGIMPVEGDDNEVCRLLDLTCGTDYLLTYEQTGTVYGIASRIQTYNPDYGSPYNSFTVRNARESGAPTEYEKRLRAISSGAIYPALTMQAYVNAQTGEIDSLAVARTKDVMEFVHRGLAQERRTGAGMIGQASFYVIYWREFERWGYRMARYPA